MWLRIGKAIYVLLAAVALLVMLAASASAAPSSTLQERQSLPSGQSLSSPGGRYVLTMRRDGDLALTTAGQPGQPGQVVWASNTARDPGARLTLQPDGNVVIVGARNAPVWASNIRGPLGGRYHLSVQDDGNVVVYAASGRAIAATRTNQRGYRNPRDWGRFWPA